MSRFARQGRVFVIEEPIWGDDNGRLDISQREDNIFICVPHLRHGTAPEIVDETIASMVSTLVVNVNIGEHIVWFYTPMMLHWAADLTPAAIIYDCMDELSGFRNAPPELTRRERALFYTADMVFTGGHTLYEAKKEQHDAVYAFPSSIDVDHFGKARTVSEEHPAQAAISHPRIGFAGVIDERLDIDLLDEVAASRPDYQFVMVGPVVKIDPSDLPAAANIHYLGKREYDELPTLMAGWDVGIMPFAMNESTRYISPTKTPEYLAAGLPVVSTPVADVVRPYGEMGLVQIGATASEFSSGIDAALADDDDDRRERVEEFLSDRSWDKTFEQMCLLITEVIDARQMRIPCRAAPYAARSEVLGEKSSLSRA